MRGLIPFSSNRPVFDSVFDDFYDMLDDFLQTTGPAQKHMRARSG
jgi:hypothetical protein